MPASACGPKVQQTTRARGVRACASCEMYVIMIELRVCACACLCVDPSPWPCPTGRPGPESSCPSPVLSFLALAFSVSSSVTNHPSLLLHCSCSRLCSCSLSCSVLFVSLLSSMITTGSLLLTMIFLMLHHFHALKLRFAGKGAMINAPHSEPPWPCAPGGCIRARTL